MAKNNPFDQEMGPKKRLVSNLFFILTTLLVAVFILWVLVSQPGKVRSRFDPTAGSMHTVEEAAEMAEPPADERMAADEELFRLCQNIQAGSMAWDADFREAYPTAAKLLQPEDNIFESRKPVISEGTACTTLAICSVDGQEKNIRRLDILTVPYTSDSVGKKLAATLFAPRTHTIVYNTATGLIQAEDVRADNFRLYAYTMRLSLEAEGGWDSAAYDLTLKGVVSDKEAQKGDAFDRVRAQPDLFERAVLTRQADSTLLRAAGGGTDDARIALTVRFNDFMFDAFGAIRLEGVSKAGGPGAFQIAFNEEAGT